MRLLFKCRCQGSMELSEITHSKLSMVQQPVRSWQSIRDIAMRQAPMLESNCESPHRIRQRVGMLWFVLATTLADISKHFRFVVNCYRWASCAWRPPNPSMAMRRRRLQLLRPCWVPMHCLKQVSVQAGLLACHEESAGSCLLSFSRSSGASAWQPNSIMSSYAGATLLL